jgi:8-oxo-dGTP diphosphatase
MINCVFEDGTRASLRHVVVHALVEKDGALLLVRRAPHLLEGGKFGLPGGFLDRDESLSEGVLRELREETGWDGQVVALLRINSRPDRPHEDRQNVAFDFVVTPLQRVGAPDGESSVVEWVPIDRLPPAHTLAFDHGESLRLYLDSRGKSGLAPILA